MSEVLKDNLVLAQDFFSLYGNCSRNSECANQLQLTKKEEPKSASGGYSSPIPALASSSHIYVCNIKLQKSRGVVQHHYKSLGKNPGTLKQLNGLWEKTKKQKTTSKIEIGISSCQQEIGNLEYPVS